MCEQIVLDSIVKMIVEIDSEGEDIYQIRACCDKEGVVVPAVVDSEISFISIYKGEMDKQSGLMLHTVMADFYPDYFNEAISCYRMLCTAS